MCDHRSRSPAIPTGPTPTSWSSRYTPRMVSALIDPRDEMFRYSVASLCGNEAAGRRLYLEKGRQIADAVLQIADRRPGGRESVAWLLDFASGYGRATRFLADAWRPETITVCDIQEAGVEFQRATFGVRAVVSAANPDDLSFDRRFDMVCASSFFTHVPPARFAAWFERLDGFLADAGTLVFSTNNLSERPDAGSSVETHFEPTSESAVLSGEVYGTTWVSDGFVRRMAKPSRSAAGLECLPRGLCGHQDLWVLDRGGGVDLAGYAGYPAGDVDHLERRGDSVRITGWARDWHAGGSVARVVLDAGGRTLDADLERGEAAVSTRWQFELPLDEVGLDRLVGITAVNGQGRSNLVALGTLRPFLDR